MKTPNSVYYNPETDEFLLYLSECWNPNFEAYLVEHFIAEKVYYTKQSTESFVYIGEL